MDTRISTLVELVEARACSTPERVAYRFLPDGLSIGDELTCRVLAERALAIAAHLQERVEPGDRALLLYPPGLEFLTAFFGCLQAGIIAVPAYPPRGHVLDARVQAIAGDCDPRIGLAPTDLVPMIRAADGSRETANLEWLGTDRLPASDGAGWKTWRPTPDTIAHLQYTSGSTATPKGVVVSHRNLLRNLLDMHVGWSHDERSVLLSWLPHFHDMGLVYGMLGPLFAAVPGYVMAPITFIQRPARWLQAITRFGVTHSVAPNFAYDLCVRKVKPADRPALDLSEWRVAVNGAEPIRAETLERFVNAFGPCGFRAEALCPGYGLAEATLKVTACRPSRLPRVLQVDAEALDRGSVRVGPPAGVRARSLVGCGWTEIDTEVRIVDPTTRLACADGQVGEVWVGGSTVAAGYWHREEESTETFGATLAQGGAGAFLRTGDLGFVHEGELYITGRIKELLIIRGQNYYPHDIELTVESCHRAFRQNGCAAFAVDLEGEERLVIALELEREGRALDFEELAGMVRQTVAEVHEIRVHDMVWLRPGGLPRTSSGKIQRQACRRAYLEGFPGRLSGASGTS
jgi:acyl-CoA synthetase (AMP-forming)/AMP-acid ligase II